MGGTGGNRPQALTAVDFEVFYRAEFAAVVRAALPIVRGDVRAAEDAAQDAFVAAETRWSKIVGYDRPDLWVRRVGVNNAISYRRKHRRELYEVDAEPDCTDGHVVGDDQVVMDAVSRLSRRQGQLIALVYFSDLSLDEAADTLGIGYESARTHHNRALVNLERHLTRGVEHHDR